MFVVFGSIGAFGITGPRCWVAGKKPWFVWVLNDVVVTGVSTLVIVPLILEFNDPSGLDLLVALILPLKDYLGAAVC